MQDSVLTNRLKEVGWFVAVFLVVPYITGAVIAVVTAYFSRQAFASLTEETIGLCWAGICRLQASIYFTVWSHVAQTPS